MADLLILLASASLSALILAFPAKRSWWWRVAAIPIYMLMLGLALRFFGRTYPGFWFPNSAFFNYLFNGVALFTEIGYDFVLALGVVDAAFVFMTRFRPQDQSAMLVRAMSVLRRILIFLILLIIAYGACVAIQFHRLPGWTYE